MKKSQSRSDLQSEAGRPCFGISQEVNHASATTATETGVFKLETEGVSRTISAQHCGHRNSGNGWKGSHLPLKSVLSPLLCQTEFPSRQLKVPSTFRGGKA